MDPKWSPILELDWFWGCLTSAIFPFTLTAFVAGSCLCCALIEELMWRIVLFLCESSESKTQLTTTQHQQWQYKQNNNNSNNSQTTMPGKGLLKCARYISQVWFLIAFSQQFPKYWQTWVGISCFAHFTQRELFLPEVNNRETIAAIAGNNDTYCLQNE